MLKTTLRSLWRRKTFTFLNILGLSVGMGACLVLFLLIRYERSYDTYHTKLDRIYRVTTAYTEGPDGNQFFQGVPVPLVASLRQAFPQFEKVAAVDGALNSQFTIPAPGGDKKIRDDAGVFYAEAGIFDIIDQPWLAGEPATALAEPNTIALDASVATAWFGDWKDAMGKTILLNHALPLKITGIMTDPPGNTDLPMRMVMSFATDPDATNTNWHNTNGKFNCFALLKKGEDIRQVAASMPAFAGKYFDNKSPGQKTSYYCQPLRAIHADVTMGSYSGKKAPTPMLWALGIIGAFLVLIACINFVNLATAQSASRAKEIGVRKVLGSPRIRLVGQFLGETGMIAFFSLLLACIIAELALPYFRNLLHEDISFRIVPLFLLGIWLAVTVLGGLYPAFVITGTDPVRAIKNTLASPKGLFLRRLLVVSQFVIAQLLMIGTIIVIQQFHYLRTMPLGFDKDAEALVRVPQDSLSKAHYAYLKNRVLGIPGVLDASLCSDPPSSRRTMTSSFSFKGKQQDFDIVIRRVDPDFLRTFHIDLAAGRLPFANDTPREYLVNETTAHELGYRHAADILGQSIDVMGGRYPVVGIVRDYNSGTPMNRIPPLILSPQLSSYEYLALRFDPSRVGDVMKTVRATWEETFPQDAYEQEFLDEKIAQYFTMQTATEKLIAVFAGIAILVSCLGLYGLVAFMVVQKTKEVGIRKVLGATVRSILVLFSREFTLLICLAFLIAAPIGYILMNKLLQSMDNRIHIGWDVFAWVIGSSILFAWMTVGYRAVRAALANPIKALQYE
ncbi:ABC transporter permease [Dinghuibacter silviterrae]|uniref:Putative permease n=1 Tax=Dinghuibacter silviterrae TaxID=1539049 RepID=A0A4R8DPR4_9BACT|nr:ABC transporter permease [Dinghuibacter silviterrae]TDW99717.1 putative permease [Dinghuibacter silviterrae]